MGNIIKQLSPDRPGLVFATELKGLSLKAMGLYAYLISRPPNWEIREDHLINQFGSEVVNILNELEDARRIEKGELCQG